MDASDVYRLALALATLGLWAQGVLLIVFLWLAFLRGSRA